MFEVLETRPSRIERIKARIQRLRGRAKDLLHRLGLPAPPKTLEEAAMSGRGLMEASWTWDPQGAELENLVDAEVMAWLYDQVLRAPSPRGVNTCVVCVAVGKLDAQMPSAAERWICDTWGWLDKG